MRIENGHLLTRAEEVIEYECSSLHLLTAPYGIYEKCRHVRYLSLSGLNRTTFAHFEFFCF
jgi:hypothetical protein